jgi:diaminohydroxyphosphoribosylaminopyrimidine deaminase/5-amino-6-(5-phosphoribosylamino)uracil reductase
MRIALALAKRGLGTTAPNPSVGAVIVDEGTGEVIARGWTQPGGRPHAETVALEKAGARARGATMYVSLEPCSHHGVTAPCADAVVTAGVARVVVGIEDPDPRVSGRGIGRLRAAGLSVTSGVLAEAADWLVRGHILRVTERRPFTQLKLALAHDGSVPKGRDGRPTFVTSEEARAQAHLLRATSDAILVGSKTVVDDDPELTCRLPGLARRSPLRVVLARRLDLPLGSKLVATARQTPVLVFCGRGADPRRRAALEEAGCTVVAVSEVENGVWLPAVAEDLVARGVTRLLVEGGAAVWRSFARAALVDAAVLFHAGGAKAPAADVQQLVAPYLAGLQMTLAARRAVGSDGMMEFRREAPAPRLTKSG